MEAVIEGGATEGTSGSDLPAREDCLTSSRIKRNRSVTSRSPTRARGPVAPVEETTDAYDREEPADDEGEQGILMAGVSRYCPGSYSCNEVETLTCMLPLIGHL